MKAVICPLCGVRKARRSCPALGHSICAVCCGTKRLTEIRCPNSCPYLHAAREHPAAAVVRQQQQDVAHLVRLMRDLSEPQAQMFLRASAFLAGYKPSELERLVDDDVADAAGAIAATIETSARGVIYEHRPATVTGERIASALKQFLSEGLEHKAAGGERDVPVVLRRIQQAVKDLGSSATGTRTFLDLIARIVHPAGAEAAAAPESGATRLIVP